MKVNHPGGQLRAYNYMGRRNKMVDAVIFFVFVNRKVVGRLAFHPERWSTNALLIHRFAVPLPRWGRQRTTNCNLETSFYGFTPFLSKSSLTMPKS